MYMDHSKGHRWSGWPGAFCLGCGAECAEENALADDWIDCVEDKNDPSGMRVVYKSDAHQELVELCDNNCATKMTREEFDKVQQRAKELENVIKRT